MKKELFFSINREDREKIILNYHLCDCESFTIDAATIHKKAGNSTECSMNRCLGQLHWYNVWDVKSRMTVQTSGNTALSLNLSRCRTLVLSPNTWQFIHTSVWCVYWEESERKIESVCEWREFFLNSFFAFSLLSSSSCICLT